MRGGKSGDVVFSSEKVDGIALIGGEVKYHFCRFNAGKAMRKRMLGVAAGCQQHPCAVRKENVSLGQHGVEMGMGLSIGADFGVRSENYSGGGGSQSVGQPGL